MALLRYPDSSGSTVARRAHGSGHIIKMGNMYSWPGLDSSSRGRQLERHRLPTSNDFFAAYACVTRMSHPNPVMWPQAQSKRVYSRQWYGTPNLGMSRNTLIAGKSLREPATLRCPQWSYSPRAPDVGFRRSRVGEAMSR